MGYRPVKGPGGGKNVCSSCHEALAERCGDGQQAVVPVEFALHAEEGTMDLHIHPVGWFSLVFETLSGGTYDER